MHFWNSKGWISFCNWNPETWKSYQDLFLRVGFALSLKTVVADETKKQMTHLVWKGSCTYWLSHTPTEIRRAELDPRNHIKINQNFTKFHALSSEKRDPSFSPKSMGYIWTKQRFDEKLLVAEVSKLVLLDNIESSLNIQKN